MSLTRKMLKGMGLTEEQIDTIIEAHSETVDGLKNERDNLKDNMRELEAAQKELATAKAELETVKKDGWKDKYEAKVAELDGYKKEIEAEKSNAEKTNAYKALLSEAGLKGDKLIETVLKTVDIAGLELKDGKLDNADEILSGIKTEWKDYIGTSNFKGSNVATPPSNTGGKLSKDEIMSITDRAERQKAISENIELFTKE